MADYGSTDRVRQSAVERYIAPARAKRQTVVTIHTGSFEKSLVERGVIQPNRFPIVCNALKSRKFLSENNLILLNVQAPPSGQSSTVTYTYKLAPESAAKVKGGVASGSPPGVEDSFQQLRGVLKRTYRQLGGAEVFHKTERKSWER
jgi:hypothetical protein